MLNPTTLKFELPEIVLASGSPRRSEIMTAVGWKFTTDIPDIDESVFLEEKPADYVRRLAREKARVIAARHPGSIVLGADTTVVVDEQIVGKPEDLEDAMRMLRLLSGRWHEVVTGVALVRDEQVRGAIQTTRVKFAALTEEEARFLAENGEPLDKAGAYAVQAQAALFIEAIEGDYWNVVGLPINLVYGLFREYAIRGQLSETSSTGSA